MTGRCPACDQLTLHEGRCYNPSCSDPDPLEVSFATISTGMAVCNRCGVVVVDRARTGAPNQAKHARWHREVGF